MRRQRRHMTSNFLLTLSLAALCLVGTSFASGPIKRNLHVFGAPPDGGTPLTTLISDPAGNLYGTTLAGGTGPCTDETGYNGCGTVFELSPVGGGGWTYAVLYSFQAADDGFYPYAPLTRDAAGNLYGTSTTQGLPNARGSGVVFELSPPATSGGAWTFNVVHTFATSTVSSTDGASPTGNLVLDSAGNLYGTTEAGGVYTTSPPACGLENTTGCGTIFELSPAGGGVWTETILHTFTGNPDGMTPIGGLTADADGNLYGTTAYGGISSACSSDVGCGTVFRLVKGTGGTWTEHILHSFDKSDGSYPYSKLSPHGDSYFGSTSTTVFELSRATTGVWSLSTLYSFSEQGNLCCESSYSGLAIDAAGDLFGTVSTDNSSGAPFGNIYELTPPSGSGAWTETTLYNFTGGSDGENPVGGLLLYRGALVGTTSDCEQLLHVGENFSECGFYGHVFALTDF